MRVPELIEVLRAELATFVDGRGTIRLQPIVDFPLVVLSPCQPDAEVNLPGGSGAMILWKDQSHGISQRLPARASRARCPSRR